MIIQNFYELFLFPKNLKFIPFLLPLEPISKLNSNES